MAARYAGYKLPLFFKLRSHTIKSL